MNRLPIEKRAQVIGLLVEGMSMRAVTRITGVSINTVTKLLEDIGLSAGLYQAQVLVNLPCKRIECDEIWAFCYSKEKNVSPADKGILGHGDVYTWTAICAETKLIASYMVGKRDMECAQAFIDDLAARLASRVQLTTDGFKPYLNAIATSFGNEIDYAILYKVYGGDPQQSSFERRYSPAQFKSAEKRVITGAPAEKHVSTSYVERQNLTMRMGMRRFTRLTNGFSKKVQNLEHAVSLHFLHYNFARIHKTLRVTPAMAAGISDHVWTLEEIAELAE
jgi:IS1 family transposase